MSDLNENYSLPDERRKFIRSAALFFDSVAEKR